MSGGSVKVVLIRSDDWEALYLNGRCVQQEHHICGYEILDHLLGLTVMDVESGYIEYEDMPVYFSGRFPDKCAGVEEFYQWCRETKAREKLLIEEDGE